MLLGGRASMKASIRTFVGLGSTLMAVACGNGGKSDGNGTPATTSPASQPGCSSNPACADCQTGYAACVCQTGDAVNCHTACPGSGDPSTTAPIVDPASQTGCTAAPACGSCQSCYDSCVCQTGNATQCTATCGTASGTGGA